MIRGILLAAGCASRFGSHKLLQPLPEAVPVAVAAVRTILSVLPRTVAVVRPGDEALAALLRAQGAEVVVCAGAHEGMGRSLACGVAAARTAAGWIIALADMPWLNPNTVGAVAALIENGAAIAAPRYRGQRGHPVGFSREYLDELVQLTGDTGARAVLERHRARLQWHECDDPGCVRDLDTIGDFAAGGT